MSVSRQGSENGTRSSSFFLRAIKSVFFQVSIFFAIVIFLGAGYAAWLSIDSSEWEAGQPVTQTLVQKIINNLNDLNGKVATLSSSAGGVWYEQTWQDVTLSRTMNTTYTNTTSKPIFVNIVVAAPVSGSSDASLYVDDMIVDHYTTNAYNWWVNAIVPPGSTYKLTWSNITLSMANPSYWWKELR